VVAVAFSPDGRAALTGSYDRTARLWDAATGQPRGEPLRHENWVNAVAFSPDGRAALTGCTDGTARLWDAATGQPRGKPLRHERAVVAVAFSPDGRTILTGSYDRTARLWNAATGQPRGEPLRHQGAVRAVAFSPDGRTALTGSVDWKARLWDTATGKPRGQPLRHEGDVWCVAFSPDGRTALTGGLDKTARLWEVVEPAPDDLDRLRAWVHVRTGKAFDDQGVLRQLSQADWLQAWKDLEAHGGDWQAKPTGRRWRFIEADEATYARQWFAAEFHLRRLLADAPNRDEPYPAAERVVELAEQLQKNNPDAPTEVLGAALFRAGRNRDAVARLNEGVEQQKQGGNVWTQLFLAMTHHRLGDSAKAKDWLRQADAQMKKREDDKDAPINWQERLRDQKLRQEAADLLNSSP
jgi:WD40 repeat protein